MTAFKRALVLVVAAALVFAAAATAFSSQDPLEVILNPSGPAAPPSTAVHVVQADGQLGRIDTDVFGDTQAVFMGRKARGTAAAPTAVLANDYMATLQAWGYDGAGYGPRPGGSVAIRAAGDWTTKSHPTWFKVEITPRGSTDNLMPFIVTPEGHIGHTGTRPDVSACAGASVRGDDNGGRITAGGGHCTLRFARAWALTDGPGTPVARPTVPACFANDETSPLPVSASPTSTTVTFTGGAPGDTITYHCEQIEN
jgi:hypothetical protein